jgi:glycosyltransferase involved in cell wall biosynthesis
MITRIRSRYSAYRYALVGADFHSEGGAWRSVHEFYKHLDENNDPVLLVDLRRGDGWKQWLCSLLFAPRIIVNGMAAMERWGVLAGLVMRKDVAVYLHDTDYMLDLLQRGKPWIYRCLACLLRERTVLCVSEGMAALYRERFGTRNTAVVYEVTELDPLPVLEAGRRHILMAGSLNRRKGYPLFARTAELAAERGLPWTFHWVGGLGEGDLAPISDAIRWWGWRTSVLPFMEKADVFFLSSADDPQPLACLEALALGKRAVVFRGTGSAEVVEGLAGCRVFANHEADSALCALEGALGETIDPIMMRTRLAEVASVATFDHRLEKIFSERRKA